MREFRRRTAVSFGLVLASALALSACSQCGKENGAGEGSQPAETARISHPASPDEITTLLASQLPADAQAFVALRDWNTLLGTFSALRPRIEASFGQLGMVETDLRNTLGIDLSNAASLESSGLALPGGLAMAVVADRVQWLVLVSDEAKFLDKIKTTFRSTPFVLSAPVEELELDGHKVVRFRKVEGGPVQLSVAVKNGIAVFCGADDAVAADASLRAFLTGPAQNYAGAPDFARALALGSGKTIAGVVDLAGYATTHEPRLLAFAESLALGAEQQRRVVKSLKDAGRAAFSLAITAEGVSLQAQALMSPESLAHAKTTFGGAADGSIQRLISKDSYAFVRLNLQPTEVFGAYRSGLSQARQTALDEQLAKVSAVAGIDIAGELIPSLGDHITVIASRARLLTLNKFKSEKKAADLFAGLGLIISVEVSDRAKVEKALDALVAALEGGAQKFTEGTNIVVGFTDPAIDIGNIVLTDKNLVLVPDRQRTEVLGMLAAPAPASVPYLAIPSVASLVAPEPSSGFFVDFATVDTGPIGQVAFARVSEDNRKLLAALGSITARVAPAADHLAVDLDVRFRPLPPPTPAP